MPFNTFDLGQVLQTAEAIKSQRSQATTDRLREQYLGEQIQGMRDDRTRQNNLDEMTFGKQRATQEYTRAGYILQSQDPKGLIETQYPDIQQMITKGGHDWATVTPEQLKQTAQMIQAKAGAEAGIMQQPQSSLGKVQSDVQSGFLTQSQADAASAPKSPSSFQEFKLSENDPGYAAFLEKNRGKGIRINPDGTIEIGGTGGGVGPAELKSPVVTKLQEAIVTSTDQLDRLNSIGQGFDPKFLQIPGRLKGGALKIKDLAGVELSPEEQQYLTKFSTFKADAAKNLSAILNQLSGAAISPAEGERLKKGIPNDEDSPTQFTAKYQAAVKDSTRAIMRANWALKNGIGVKSVEQLAHTMPLAGIDEVYSQRANAIWQELGGTPETKQQAVQQANQEFGLAR